MAKTLPIFSWGLKTLKNIRVCWIALICTNKEENIHTRFCFMCCLICQKHEKHKNNTSLTQFHIKQKHKERYENTYATLAFPFDNNNIHTRFVFFSCYLLRPPTAFFSAGLCGSGSVVVPATPFRRYGTLWWMTEPKASQMTSDSFHFTKLSSRVSQCLPHILSQIQKGNVSTLACIWALDCSEAGGGGTLRAMAIKPKKQAVAPKLRKTHTSEPKAAILCKST